MVVTINPKVAAREEFQSLFSELGGVSAGKFGDYNKIDTNLKLYQPYQPRKVNGDPIHERIPTFGGDLDVYEFGK